MARLLVVDDDEGDRMVLQTILERAQHQVYLAGDGDEALEVCLANQIELVVTDLQMRNVHGLELISIIRDFKPRPHIIAVSGTGEVQLDMAKLLGAERTLVKPIRPDELLGAITELLSGAD